MKNYLDLSECKPVNHLWTDLLDEFGIEKAKQIITQAFNLQNMKGDKGTLPVLFVKTGGVALTSYELLRLQTGLSLGTRNKEVILYTPKEKLFQVLYEAKDLD